MLRKVLSALLSIIMIVSCMCIVSSAEETTGTLNVVSFNVDGLPVPSFLSSTKRNPLKSTKIMAEQINASDCDILCAQEDFNFHRTLEKNLDMEYATLTSGGAGIGDGLNIFSKYPIYNVNRVAWDSAYGIFDCGSDELTPKGILYCTIEIEDGVFVDVYTLHADAWEDDKSMTAKAEQFDQLMELIETVSGTDRAVILTGDFNTNYSVFREGYKAGRYNVDLCQKLLDNFVSHGFKDSWIEYNNNGNYDFTYNEMYNRYGCQYNRVWDTLDHVYYRDGAGVSFELISAVYEDFDSDEVTWDGHVSDHSAVKTSLKYTVNKAELKAPEALTTEKYDFFTSTAVGAGRLVELVFKAIVNLPLLFKNGIGWIK
ncbi:MAG: endonuclease/exonuclease/phosphatase family protein [Clostridia bacterium]|nr:endonuclease/exonuclease/phosphatase family protein [Clostridia bacterium]